jgi:hypothetical protein
LKWELMEIALDRRKDQGVSFKPNSDIFVLKSHRKPVFLPPSLAGAQLNYITRAVLSRTHARFLCILAHECVRITCIPNPIRAPYYIPSCRIDLYPFNKHKRALIAAGHRTPFVLRMLRSCSAIGTCTAVLLPLAHPGSNIKTV